MGFIVKTVRAIGDGSPLYLHLYPVDSFQEQNDVLYNNFYYLYVRKFIILLKCLITAFHYAAFNLCLNRNLLYLLCVEI